MYNTVLLAYDGSEEGRLALREGARMAQITNAEVCLLAVVDLSAGITMGGTAGPGAAEHQINDYQAVLETGVARLAKMGFTASSRLETGDPGERICAIAHQIRADLVIIGHRQQGPVSRWFHSSVAAYVMDHLECSMLVARKEVSDDMLM
ncbi:MAG: universal stress protein [Marinosulfonomonas sp.]|nr:universal stress protein [Marinosulfonomonas sp.]